MPPYLAAAGRRIADTVAPAIELPASFVAGVGGRCGRPPRCERQYRGHDRGPHHKIPGVTPLAVMAVLRANN